MNWWQRLFNGKRMEKELDSELRFHLEQQVADKVRAGMTEDVARRTTRLEFGGMAQIKAMAPLAEVMQYQSQLKSVTGGQGSFSMELSHYEAVPPFVQQQIAAQYKPKAEEE